MISRKLKTVPAYVIMGQVKRDGYLLIGRMLRTVPTANIHRLSTQVRGLWKDRCILIR